MTKLSFGIFFMHLLLPLACELFLKKMWDLDMLYRICSNDCVPNFREQSLSHWQWLLPEIQIGSSQQTSFCQKWLKISAHATIHITPIMISIFYTIDQSPKVPTHVVYIHTTWSLNGMSGTLVIWCKNEDKWDTHINRMVSVLVNVQPKRVNTEITETEISIWFTLLGLPNRNQ